MLGPPTVERVGISGLIVDEAGHVLTVGDVLDGADLVSAENENGQLTACEIIGYDPQTNVGVLRTSALDGEPPAFAEGLAIETGLPIVAVGNPFGLGTSIQFGHVTGTGRTIESLGYEWSDLLQISIDVNPGDQGGPIATLDGRVIGMLLIRYRAPAEESPGIEARGISFALPIDKARTIVRQLIVAHAQRQAEREGERPWLGVRLEEVESGPLRSQLRLAPDQGVLIQRIYGDSPADAAGLRVNDVVVEFNAQPVLGLKQFGFLVRGMNVGESVRVVVIREGERRALDLIIGAR